MTGFLAEELQKKLTNKQLKRLVREFGIYDFMVRPAYIKDLMKSSKNYSIDAEMNTIMNLIRLYHSIDKLLPHRTKLNSEDWKTLIKDFYQKSRSSEFYKLLPQEELYRLIDISPEPIFDMETKSDDKKDSVYYDAPYIPDSGSITTTSGSLFPPEIISAIKLGYSVVIILLSLISIVIVFNFPYLEPEIVMLAILTIIVGIISWTKLEKEFQVVKYGIYAVISSILLITVIIDPNSIFGLVAMGLVILFYEITDKL